MINVLTSDGHRLFEAALFGSFLIASIVLFFECIIYACLVLGYTALTGVATYIIFVPVQVWLLYLTMLYQSISLCWLLFLILMSLIIYYLKRDVWLLVVVTSTIHHSAVYTIFSENRVFGQRWCMLTVFYACVFFPLQCTVGSPAVKKAQCLHKHELLSTTENTVPAAWNISSVVLPVI